MALTPTQTSICNKIKDDFDSIVEPARKAQRLVNEKITELKSALNNLKDVGFSSSDDIQNAVNDLEQDVNEVIPDVDDEAINEINSIISNCTYLGEDELLKNPTALLKSMTKSTFDSVENIVESVPLLDFTVGGLIDTLINSVANQIPNNPSDLGLAKGLEKADKLINCLSSICGADYSSIAQQYADEVEDLYDKLNIVGDPANPNYGKFDVEKIYNDVGLSVTEKIKMDDVTKSVQDAKATASSNIDQAVNTTKSIRKSTLSIL